MTSGTPEKDIFDMLDIAWITIITTINDIFKSLYTRWIAIKNKIRKCIEICPINIRSKCRTE